MEKVNQRGKYLFIAGIISLIIAIVILFVIPDPSANNVEIAKKATSAVTPSASPVRRLPLRSISGAATASGSPPSTATERSPANIIR